MQRVRILIIGISLVFCITSCNSSKNTEEIKNYEYEEQVQLNDILNEKVGDWIEEGMNCYGIIMIERSNKPLFAKPIYAKVIFIESDKIKMKALEDVELAPDLCGKLGISKGATWWEEDGDLFKTKEEVERYLKELNVSEVLEGTPKGKFTID